jgi:hypothetical protein
MGVSVSGSDLGFTMVRRAAVTVIAIFVVLSYLYGPAVSPAMRTAAVGQCNDHAEGNWRSYRLSWDVGVYPHWMCGDASKPTERAISLGWWTNPFND